MIIPSKFRPEMNEQVYRLALLGANNTQIAEFFGVAPRTIERWSSHNEVFRQALQRGRIEADMRVAHALYRRATGYTYREVTSYTRLNPKSGEMMVVRQEIVEKHHAPDAYACIKWLSTRQKTSWADLQKSSVDITYRGEMDITMVQEQLRDRTKYTTEELQEALKAGLTQIAKDASN